MLSPIWSSGQHDSKSSEIFPSLQNNVKYEIAQGNDDGVFEMRSHHHGTASLHFKHHLHQPATYDIEIVGRPLDYSNLNDGAHSDLDMNLRIIVTH